MKRFLSGGSNKGEHRKDPKSAMDGAEGKDGGFPTLDGYLMIFGGLAAYDSKHCKKLTRHEVYTAEPAAPSFLRWSESAITFDQTDHPKASHSQEDIHLWSTRSSAQTGSPKC